MKPTWGAWALAAMLASPAAASEGTAAGAGVVVADVVKASSADAAGVQPGDVLETWTPAAGEAAQGRLATLFDVLDVEVEQAPLGLITLHGRREGRALS